MKKCLLCLFCLIILVFSDQMPGATFLLIPPSARANGMAYAFTAIADDAAACYHNAAGLAFLAHPDIQISYCGYQTNFMPGNRYFYLGFGYPYDAKSGLGMDITWLYIPPYGVHIPEEGPHTAHHLTVKLAYARKLRDAWSLGAGFKIIYQYNNRESWWDDQRRPPGIGSGRQGLAVTPALELNSIYRVSNKLRIGTVLHNIGPRIKYTQSDTGDPLPRLIRVGVAYVAVDNRYAKCTVSGEVTKILVGVLDGGENTFWENAMREFRNTWRAIGLAVTLHKLISLRGGYFHDQEGGRRGFTFGGGLHAEPFTFDIGIDETIYDFPTQNRTVSISYTF